MKVKLDKTDVAHLLKHLQANSIHLEDCEGKSTDWYIGVREKFVKRHVKLIKTLKEALHGN
jgi:hypothetical protein